jgi:hypothetical protein
MPTPLPVLNLAEATFECTFGRGCPGVCCQAGRPPVKPEEAARIDENLAKFLPHLRPEARAELERGGYVSRRQKAGRPMMRVVAGWCIFFNEGCVLHKVGMAEGDKFRYKPAPCSLFPLEHDEGQWYVRQHGYKGEQWVELFCLAPANTTVPAAESLGEEMDFARRQAEEQAAKAEPKKPARGGKKGAKA